MDVDAESAKGQAGTATGARHPLTFDWVPAEPWTCPRCGRAVVTRELAPRCAACGFVEAGD